MSRFCWGVRQTLFVATVALLLGGCSGSEQPDGSITDDDPQNRSIDTGPVRVVVLDDSELADAINSQWHRAESDVKIEIVEQTSDELLEAAPEALDTDIIIYPVGLLGEMAERRWITPIPSEVLGRSSDGLLNLDRRVCTTWGEETFAVTFGSPQLMLAYRRDIFESEVAKKLGLAVPKTWTEYQETAQRLADRGKLEDFLIQEDAAWSGAVEPLGPGWAGQVLLARAAAYTRARGRNAALFNVNTMEPLIATVPFVKALEELVEAAEASGRKEELIKFSAHDARRELLEGRAAMAICWPTRSENEAVDRDGQITEVRFAPLPGAAKFYAFGARQWRTRPDSENPHVPVIGISGRLGSVTRGSRHSKAAFDLLVWLTSEANGKAIAPKSGQTTMFRVSHLSDATQWVDPAISSDGAESYAEAIRESNASEVWLCAIRIPARARYLAALDSAVHQAVAGMSPIDALREARQRWMEITDEIGVDAQQQAYRRSLGH